MTKRMVIMFTGWIECNTDQTTFQYIGDMAANRAVISGTKFMYLDEHEQDNYILEDLGQAITYSVDGEFNELSIDIEDV